MSEAGKRLRSLWQEKPALRDGGQIDAFEKQGKTQSFFIQHFPDETAEKCIGKATMMESSARVSAAHMQQLHHEPRAEDQLDPFLAAVGNRYKIITVVLLPDDKPGAF